MISRSIPSGSDIIRLSYFLPEQNNYKAILVNSATGVKQGYYAEFARYFASLGYTVITYDYRGIGSSKPESLKGYKCSLKDWAEDYLNVLGHIQKEYKPEGLFIIGHSLGGQLIGLSPVSNKAKAIILVASQSGYWKLWKGPARLRMWFNWHVALPALANLFGYFPGKKLGLMEDLPKQVALEWSRWGRSPGYLFEHIPEAGNNFLSIGQKIISYSFKDDPFAPDKAVEALLGKFQARVVERKKFPSKVEGFGKIGHFSFFRNSFKNLFWKSLARELESFESQ